MADKDMNKEQEQTGIDNLNQSLTSFSSKVEKHKTVIFGVAGAIIVAILAGFGVYFWNRHQDKQSGAKFATAMVEANKSAQKDAQTSNNPDSAYSAIMTKKMQELAKAEEGKAGATLANIELASLYYNAGKAKETLAAIEAADIDEPLMKMQAIILKGDCYVDMGKMGEALGAYDEAFGLAKDENPEVAVRALMKKARVLDAQKKYADALAVYEQVINDYPQSAQNPAMNVEAYAERERALAGK